MLKAYLQPKRKPNDRHWYAYDVVFDGETIVTDSRDPEHDLARALLARGIKGKVTLHDGPTRKPRTVVNIEKAAPWCFRQCQTTIRLWHDQHPSFQFGRCSP